MQKNTDNNKRKALEKYISSISAKTKRKKEINTESNMEKALEEVPNKNE